MDRGDHRGHGTPGIAANVTQAASTVKQRVNLDLRVRQARPVRIATSSSLTRKDELPPFLRVEPRRRVARAIDKQCGYAQLERQGLEHGRQSGHRLERELARFAGQRRYGQRRRPETCSRARSRRGSARLRSSILTRPAIDGSCCSPRVKRQERPEVRSVHPAGLFQPIGADRRRVHRLHPAARDSEAERSLPDSRVSRPLCWLLFRKASTMGRGNAGLFPRASPRVPRSRPRAWHNRYAELARPSRRFVKRWPRRS